MATKRIKKRLAQKQTIPSDYYTIRETIGILQSYHFEISYDGLAYYRKLGIIKPIRFKGYMDKYFYFPDLWGYITTTKLLTNLLDTNLEDLGRYFLFLPKEIYFDLPRMVINAYIKTWGLEQDKTVKWGTAMYDTLCIGMKKVLKRVITKCDPLEHEQFIALLEKETQNFKDTRWTKTLLTDPYL